MFRNIIKLSTILLVINVVNLSAIAAPLEKGKAVVRQVKVHFNYFQNASEESVRAQIKVIEGQEYDQLTASE